MTDKNFDITVIDSLMNLQNKTDNELMPLISELGLSFTPLFWGEIHKCLTAEQITPGYELLFFFDAIFSASGKDIKNIKISEVNSIDNELTLTFRDLCEKAEYLRKDSDLQLSDILKISSEYLATLDAKVPETVGSGEDIVISEESGKALIHLGLDASKLPYGYVKESAGIFEAEEKYLPEGLCLFLVTGSSTDYLRFAESDELSALNLTKKTVDERGLLYTILEMCCGAEINASVLPSLPDLVSGYCGKHIFVAEAFKEEILTSLAEGFGLTAIRIAESLALPAARIKTSDGKINIRTGFLRRLFSFEKKLTVNIPAEQIKPTKYERLAYTLPFETTATSISSAIEVNRHTVSARYTKELSFSSGMNAVLDSLFAILARGADRRKSGITVKIGMRRENISGGIGAILGAYRAIIELCLPEINSEIVFSDEDYILCTAFARAGKQNFRVDPRQNKLYLLSFARLDNSLPKFSELRRTCDYLLKIINEGTALSVRSINGTLSAEACGMPIIYEGGISGSTVAQGFIVETAPEAKISAALIGAFGNGTSENNNTEETL